MPVVTRDITENIIIAFRTTSTDLPIVGNAISKSYLGGANDIFLININILKENKSELVKNNLIKKLLVYPIPIQNTLQIEYPELSQKEVNYKILNLSGKTFQQGTLTDNIIDVSKLKKKDTIFLI